MPASIDLYPDPASRSDGPFESAGAQYLESPDLRGWRSAVAAGPGGGFPRVFTSGGASIAGGVRALLDSANAPLLPRDYKGVLDPGAYRQPRLSQLVTVLPTDSDRPEYVIEDTISSSAAPVEEATALTGSSGSKPSSEMHFTRASADVVTIAVWIASTRRAVMDGKELRDLIDRGLTLDVLREIEDQMITGTGLGEELPGVLSAISASVGPPAEGESALDLLRAARTKVETDGKTTPTAVVLNPADAEAIDLLKVNDEVNRFVIDPSAAPGSPLWGMTKVVSEACPAGTGIVADWRFACLFDREQTSISLGTVGDDFTRNIVRVLAEARAGFAVIRPSAFCTVDFAA